MKGGKDYSIKNKETGETLAENVSFFEAARLICEELPFNGLGLSQEQIEFLKNGGDGNAMVGNEFLGHSVFHYPSRENPSDKFTILTRRKWTQSFDYYESLYHDRTRRPKTRCENCPQR